MPPTNFGRINVRTTVATRGERLALVRLVFTSKDGSPEAFSVAALAVVEINDSNRIAEIVVIEADDVDTAFAELDARYLSGEAAVHARTWSRHYARLRRAQSARTTADHVGIRVNIDHRSTQRVEADDPTALIRATWEVVPHGRVYIEAVHRLNDVGVAITYIASGTSQAGFDADWRAVDIMTADGDIDQPQRDIRRGRPRRRARPIRRTATADAATGERSKPCGRGLPGVLRGQRLERDGGSVGGQLCR